jgi:hypothetical protein
VQCAILRAPWPQSGDSKKSVILGEIVPNGPVQQRASNIWQKPVAAADHAIAGAVVLRGQVSFPDPSVHCEPQSRRGDCARAGNGFPGNAAPLKRMSLWSRCLVTWQMTALCDLARIRARAASNGPVLFGFQKSVTQTETYESAGCTVFRMLTGPRWNASGPPAVACVAARVPHAASGRHKLPRYRRDLCFLLHT